MALNLLLRVSGLGRTRKASSQSTCREAFVGFKQRQASMSTYRSSVDGD